MNVDELEAGLEGSDALFLEPRATFDVAIIGIASRADGLHVVAYDVERVVRALMDAHGWDEDEAREWYEVNTACTYDGRGTPVFIHLVK